MAAIKKVFLEKLPTKISVSDIVSEAGIPRGSFYQYFKDLEDVFTHLADLSMHAFETEIMERVQGKNIAFFAYLRLAFDKDYVFFKESQHQKVISKFFSHNQLFTIDYDNYRKRKETFYKRFIATLDTSMLTGLKTQRIMNLYYYLAHLKIQLIHKVINQRTEFEDARSEYLWMIDTFEAGIKETCKHDKHI